MCKLALSANKVVSNLETLGKSFTYYKNSIGPRTEPCGTSGGLRRRGGLCNNYRRGLLGSKFQNAVVCTKAHYNRHFIGSYLKSANQASSFNACNVETSFPASNW